MTQSEVFHVNEKPQAKLVGDLANGQGIQKNSFDCMILTQTLQFIDVPIAIIWGSVLLVIFPGISQISRYDMDRWGDYWRFTTLSAKRQFEDVFPSENVEVKAYGNVLVAVAFLHGLAAGELEQKELDFQDPDYQVMITVRAVKPGTGEKK